MLTFAWSQTGGTAVTLSGAATATATFTAPAAAGALTFDLSVNDGNGGADTDTVVITVNAACRTAIEGARGCPGRVRERFAGVH